MVARSKSKACTPRCVANQRPMRKQQRFRRAIQVTQPSKRHGCVAKRPSVASIVRIAKKPASRAAAGASNLARITAKLDAVNWVPLESNPEMFNEFAHQIGLPKSFEFVDVLGIDAEFLSEVPRPCFGVTLLFRCSDEIELAAKDRQAASRTKGTVLSSDLIYIKQYVGNACGTIAAIHCIANSQERLGVSADTPMGQFLKFAKGKTAQQLGASLASMTAFHVASEECAAGGQTEAPDASDDTDHHFIAFVEKGGHLYELDGTTEMPIDHGRIEVDILESVAHVVKTNFIDKDPGNIQFNLMALVQSYLH